MAVLAETPAVLAVAPEVEQLAPQNQAGRMALVARGARVVAPVVGLVVTQAFCTKEFVPAAHLLFFLVRPETPEPPVLIPPHKLVAVVVALAVIFMLAVVVEAGAVIRVMQVTPVTPAMQVLQEQQVMRALPEAPLVYL